MMSYASRTRDYPHYAWARLWAVTVRGKPQLKATAWGFPVTAKGSLIRVVLLNASTWPRIIKSRFFKRPRSHP